MNKSAIFSAMSPENQAMALAAVGITCDGDEYAENQDPSEVPTWDALDVGVEKTTRGPIANTASIFRQMAKSQKPQAVDAYGMPVAGAEEDMMLATGMV